jgi:hypothetical protein
MKKTEGRKSRSTVPLRRQSRRGVSVQDDVYPTMSALYTKHSIQDTKLASCEEQQGPARKVVLLSKL